MMIIYYFLNAMFEFDLNLTDLGEGGGPPFT